MASDPLTPPGTEQAQIDPMKVLRHAGFGWAADELERLKAEVRQLRGALETLHRYDDGLRASNWPGLANVVRDALASGENQPPN